MFDMFFMKKFKEELAEKLRGRFPEGAMKYMRVDKNNGTGYEGLCIRFPESKAVVPVISLDRLAERLWNRENSILTAITFTDMIID